MYGVNRACTVDQWITNVSNAKRLLALDEWHKAMESELQLLKELKTFTLTELPEGRKAIGSKWTYRIKQDDKGDLTWFRSSFVVFLREEI